MNEDKKHSEPLNIEKLEEVENEEGVNEKFIKKLEIQRKILKSLIEPSENKEIGR